MTALLIFKEDIMDKTVHSRARLVALRLRAR
jgi:hypothetical protein